MISTDLGSSPVEYGQGSVGLVSDQTLATAHSSYSHVTPETNYIAPQTPEEINLQVPMPPGDVGGRSIHLDDEDDILEEQGRPAARRSNSRSGFRVFVRVDTRSGQRMPSRDAVCAYFAQFGPILDCYLPESATNVAYVCFEDQETMTNVLQLSQHFIGNTCLLVCKAAPRPDYSINTDRVFVKNVPESVSWQDLRTYFCHFGEVTDVYIPKDKMSGLPKRFAFVTFREVSMARRALAHEQHVIYDTPITVMPAEPRPHRSNSLVGGMRPMEPTAMYGAQFQPFQYPVSSMGGWVSPIPAPAFEAQTPVLPQPGLEQLAAMIAAAGGQQVQGSSQDEPASPDMPARIFVQGMHPQLSIDAIRSHFSAFGKVCDVYIPRHNPEICYITLSTAAQVDEAVEYMNATGLTIAGYPVSAVKKADARPPPPPPQLPMIIPQEQMIQYGHNVNVMTAHIGIQPPQMGVPVVTYSTERA